MCLFSLQPIHVYTIYTAGELAETNCVLSIDIVLCSIKHVDDSCSSSSKKFSVWSACHRHNDSESAANLTDVLFTFNMGRQLVPNHFKYIKKLNCFTKQLIYAFNLISIYIITVDNKEMARILCLGHG